jgi:hypothetical protein
MFQTPASVGRAWAAVLATCATICFASLAQAQVNPLGRAGMNLTDQDIKMIMAAAEPIFKDPQAKPGKVATWRNEATGNFGTIELVGVSEFQGMPCRRLRHIVSIKKELDPRRVTTERCRTESGEWKIKM